MSLDKQVPKGVEVPDQELRSTIDKTASFVIKNGDNFEKRLKTSDDSVNKFSFLFNEDKFYNYYQWKLGKYEVKETRSTASVDVAQKTEEKPAELQFLMDIPTISSFDLQIIKMTAMFVARNGDDYGKKLHEHEVSNGRKAQFEFMNETHSLHPVFQGFIKQYKLTIKCLEEGFEPVDLFNDSYIRAKHYKHHKVKQDTANREKERRQIEYASIEWQDFTIIGKLQFDAIDKVTELAVPLNRDDLVYRTLEGKVEEVKMEIHPIHPLPSVKDGVEDEEKDEKEEKEEKEPSDHSPSANDSSPIPKGIKIKSAGQTRLKKSTISTIKCPLTNRLIPESQFDEHIRILLRDTNYDQQKQNYINKNFKYGSNLTNDEVYDNIKRLSRKRGPDLQESGNKKIQP